MPLNLNGLGPDETMLALHIAQDNCGKSVGQFHFVVPLTRNRPYIDNVEEILAKCAHFGINVRCELITPHLVDKRHYPRVKFTIKNRLRMPCTAVFIFETAQDQLRFKLAFG
ncbi:hypothetical protein ILT44_26980 [Microvirga sp. BT689]|uniref:hypothetical protein n=1 Tax=Microvirga arvi TaxID=2778731 RepID=UPI00194EA8EC|nr:hypothetical protein [Microvirga arvi]MBM6583849.1 hypothetical protein [Microvirga arvi]